MTDASDRTIPATTRRRQQAQREGMLPTAALPAWGATVAVTLLLLPAWWQATVSAAAAHLRTVFSVASLTPPATAGSASGFAASAWLPVGVLIPTIAIVGAAAAAGLAVRLVVDGFQWHAGRLAPDLRRLAPLAGLRRILSWRTLLSAAAGGGWLALLVIVASAPSTRILRAAATASEPVPPGIPLPAALARVSVAIPEGIGALLPLVAVAVVVAVCRWILFRLEGERRLRMTPEELREEMRSLEATNPIRHGQGKPVTAGAPRPEGVQVAAGAS